MKLKYKHLLFILIFSVFICIFMISCTDKEIDISLTEDEDIIVTQEIEKMIQTEVVSTEKQISFSHPNKLSDIVYPEWINLSENFGLDYKIYSPIDDVYNLKRLEDNFIENFAWEFADIWRQELDYQYNKCIKNISDEYEERFINQQSSWEDYFYNDVFPDIAINYDENGMLIGYGYEGEATLIWLDRLRTRTLEIMRIQRFIEKIDTVEFYYSAEEKIISEKEAVELVVNLFFDENDFELSEDGPGLLKKFKNKDYYLGYIDYIHNEFEHYYLIQHYEIVENEIVTNEEGEDIIANHSVTYNWFKVDMETREVIPMFYKDERGRTVLNENYEQATREE